MTEELKNYTNIHEKKETDPNFFPIFMVYCYNCDKDTTTYRAFLDVYLCSDCVIIIRKQLLGDK